MDISMPPLPQEEAALLEAVSAVPKMGNILRRILFQRDQMFDELRKKKAQLERYLYACPDCGINTKNIHEVAYMLFDFIWVEAMKDQKGCICIGCLEKRLGRELIKADFNFDIPLNSVDFKRSERLRNRMGIIVERVDSDGYFQGSS